MLPEMLHGLSSQRLVVYDEGVTSPDVVVNDKHVPDKIYFVMHYVTSTKLQQNHKNVKYPKDCREKSVMQACSSLHAACCVYARYKRRAVD